LKYAHANVALFESSVAKYSASLDMAKKKVAELGDNPYFSKATSGYLKSARMAQKFLNDATAELSIAKRSVAVGTRVAKAAEKQANQASKMTPDAPVDMQHIFSLLSEEAGDGETTVWATICSQQLVGKVHADVDGKYSIDVSGGSYYLYATFESAYSQIIWFVPVTVAEPKDIAVDLHNENAVRITNKSD
jgi:hypothetical protein